MAHPFLSDEWIDEARRIRTEFEARVPAAPVLFKMNLVVTDLPWPPGRLDAHLDTSATDLELEVGHLAGPDLTVTIAHGTLRSLFLAGDPQQAMAAFLSGRIKVDGDISKLLTVQAVPEAVDPVVGEIYGRLRDITE